MIPQVVELAMPLLDSPIHASGVIKFLLVFLETNIL